VVQVNDLSRSVTVFDPSSTLVVVVEMSKARWLVSGAIPGIERQPLKKLEPDATALSNALPNRSAESRVGLANVKIKQKKSIDVRYRVSRRKS